MRRTSQCTVLSAFMLILILAVPATGQDRDSGWEIFAPVDEEEPISLSLDPEDDPGLPKPKYSLDELTGPGSGDPDVYIRYKATRNEAEPETEAAPEIDETTVDIPSVEAIAPVSPPEPVDAIPIVETAEDHKKALESQAPVIMFEGKRWVLSESRDRYIDPLARGVEEARAIEEARTENQMYRTVSPGFISPVVPAPGIAPATGALPYGAPVVPPPQAVYPQGWQPAYPQGTQPAYPQGTQPAYPQGTQPAYPQGWQPAYPQGTQPYNPNVPYNPAMGVPNQVQPWGAGQPPAVGGSSPAPRRELPSNPREGFMLRGRRKGPDYGDRQR